MALAGSIGACDPGCDPSAIARAGLRLTIQDAESGASLDRVAIVTVVRLQPAPDSLTGPLGGTLTTPNPLDLARENPGLYEVRVEAEGYQPWMQRAVVRRTDDCGYLVAAVLRARLEPAA